MDFEEQAPVCCDTACSKIALQTGEAHQRNHKINKSWISLFVQGHLERWLIPWILGILTCWNFYQQNANSKQNQIYKSYKQSSHNWIYITFYHILISLISPMRNPCSVYISLWLFNFLVSVACCIHCLYKSHAYIFYRTAHVQYSSFIFITTLTLISYFLWIYYIFFHFQSLRSSGSLSLLKIQGILSCI